MLVALLTLCKVIVATDRAWSTFSTGVIATTYDALAGFSGPGPLGVLPGTIRRRRHDGRHDRI